MRNIEQIYFLLEVINILKNNNYESIGILIDDNHEKQLNSIRESEIEKLKKENEIILFSYNFLKDFYYNYLNYKKGKRNDNRRKNFKIKR